MRLLFTDEIDVLFYWLHQWLIFLGFLNIFTMSEILLLISDRKFFVGTCWRIFSVHIDMENDRRKGSYWLIAWIKIFAELFYVFRGSEEWIRRVQLCTCLRISILQTHIRTSVEHICWTRGTPNEGCL
jgi:hypothetical protein